MRSKLILALSVLLPVMAAAPALALDTSRTHQVNVEGNRVGTWKLRNRVVDTGDACRYTVEWSDNSGPPLSRTVLCKIDESKASDNFDCEMSRRGSFDTLIQKASGTCRGFDEFGQETTITTLIAGESSQGIDGIFVANSIGDVQSLSVN